MFSRLAAVMRASPLAVRMGAAATRSARAAVPMGAVCSTSTRTMSGVSDDHTGLKSQLSVVLGAQWGDEGKGKLSDVLGDVPADETWVCRFNGGSNAGHTIVAHGQKFAFHLLPCGLIHDNSINILGNGVVCEIPQLFHELEQFEGTDIDWKGRLFISDRAHLLFNYHKEIDGILEERRGGKSIGTTKKGIGPCYSSKALRLGLRAGHLKDFDVFAGLYRTAVEQHKLMFGFDYDTEAELEYYRAIQPEVVPMLIDSVFAVNDAYKAGKRIVVEGANAALLDQDFGTYPFNTSSTTTAGGVCTGLGLSPEKVDCVLGVVKAYTTRVGWGPFPTELTDDLCGGERPRGAPGTEIGKHLQEVGGEIGVTTKRKRRCGWLDIPLLQYSQTVNNYSSLNITKLDVLDDLDEIKIGVKYHLHGKPLGYGAMPSTIEELGQVEVEYETMPGWKQSIVGVTEWSDLPENAQKYIQRIEELVGAPISWIGTGPGREQMVLKPLTM